MYSLSHAAVNIAIALYMYNLQQLTGVGVIIIQ